MFKEKYMGGGGYYLEKYNGKIDKIKKKKGKNEVKSTYDMLKHSGFRANYN